MGVFVSFLQLNIHQSISNWATKRPEKTVQLSAALCSTRLVQVAGGQAQVQAQHSRMAWKHENALFT